MSGARCKNFLRDLDICKLKSIKVKIKRPNIPEPEYPQPIYRGLDDPKSLVVHFKREALRGIFDREDIAVNQDFLDEKVSKDRSRSINDDRSSVSSEEKYDRKKKRSTHTKYEDSAGRSKDKYSRRSSSSDMVSRSSPRRKDRSRSPSYRKRSSSPKESTSRKDSHSRVKRSRSCSPSSMPVKRPGLYIPPKSDYLRYGKVQRERTSRSRSPVPSHSRKSDKENRRKIASNELRRSKTPYEDYASTSKQRMRSPGYHEMRRSRSLSSEKSSDRHKKRTNTKYHDRSRSPKEFNDQRDYKYRGPPKSHSRLRSPLRRSRSPRRSKTPTQRSRSPRGRSPSRRTKEYSRRRSRSHSRNRDRIREEDIHFQQNIPPYIIKDGEYWIPAGPFAGPGYIPRGYLPPHMLYPRGFHPPVLMPRIPMMQPFRPRIYRPRMQTPSSNVTTLATNESQIINNSQKGEDEQRVEKCESEDNSKVHKSLKESTEKECGVIISEICNENEESNKNC